MSPYDWWSVWHIVSVSFSKDVVMSSDTCSAVATTVVRPCQVLFVLVSCNRMRRGLLAAIV